MIVNVLTDGITTVEIIQDNLPNVVEVFESATPNVVEIVTAGPQGPVGPYPETGSFATTGSNTFKGNQIISGSISVTGGISGSFSGSGANLFNIPASGITGLNLSQITSGSVSASISPNNGLQVNTNIVAPSFTGSFSGSGANLFNIPASGITGLNLSQISSGSVSASISEQGGLQVNTNVVATSFTGSLQGTATNAETASHAPSYVLTSSTSSMSVLSSSYAQTASYAADYLPLANTSSMLAPYVLTSTTSSMSVLSSSYALTASHAPSYLPLTGGSITGNLTVAGTASITYLNVTFESASVIYSSGSNVFGDATNDTQTLNGTVIVSGSQQVTGSLKVTGPTTIKADFGFNVQNAALTVLNNTLSEEGGESVGTGVVGYGSTGVFGQTGDGIGVWGIANGTSAIGVRGQANNTGAIGVFAVGDVGLYTSGSTTAIEAIGPVNITGNTQITGSLSNGLANVASGLYSHAEGSYTIASGISAHAEGRETSASGDYSHAEGESTVASGRASHAEGFVTVASGSYQHVQGQYNISSSARSAFIHGNGTSNANRSNLIFASGSEVQITGSLKVSGSITGSLFGTASNATKAETVVISDNTTYGGVTFYPTFVSSTNAPANLQVDSLTLTYNPSTNILTTTSSRAITASYVTGSIFTGANPALTSSYALTASYALNAGSGGGGAAFPFSGSAVITGSLTVTQGITGSLFGIASNALTASFINPLNQTVTITGSFTQGEAGNKALGLNSHAEGRETSASGDYSHAEGYRSKALGDYSHAEGVVTLASGYASHAEGSYTIASGIGAHAEGYLTSASGYFSHAEGGWNDFDGTEFPGGQAIGNGSHAEGFGTIAVGNASHVQGLYNITSSTDGAFIHGNGTSDAARSNLIYAAGTEVQITGSLKVSGSLLVNGVAPGGGASFPYTGSAVITGSLVVTGSTTSTQGFIKPGAGSQYLLADGSTSAGTGGSPFPYTGDAQIAGSLNVTGSLNISGSLQISGSATFTGPISASNYQTSWTEYSGSSLINGWNLTTPAYTSKNIRYMIIGKLAHIEYFINGTGINTGPTNFTLPFSASGNVVTQSNAMQCFLGATTPIGMATITSGSITVNCLQFTTATAQTATWGGTANKGVRGLLTIEIA